MAYFTTAYPYNDSIYSPIFQLLDDIDLDDGSNTTSTASRPVYPVRQVTQRRNNNNAHPAATQNQTTNAGPAAKFIQSFSPRFDVRECKNAYLLDGELPGVNQRDIDIEFTDPHTLRIKGVVKRQYFNIPTINDEDGEDKENEEKEDDDASSVRSSNSHQATVEDADDDDEDEMIRKKEKAAAAKETKVAKKATPVTTVKKNDAAPAPAWKYWSSERAVGSFHRTFNFPARVNQDAVKANLKDGILSVVVPKEVERKGGKKILVSAE